MKKKILSLSFAIIISFLCIFSSKKSYASSIDDLNEYISYYQDSDEIYDMSDRLNITKTNYDIKDYEDFLYATNVIIKNSDKSLIKGSDPISNIIPIEYFYNEVKDIFVGKEYIFFIETKKIEEENQLIAYKNHVLVIDINDNVTDKINNSYIELKINLLFEYDYVTLLKDKDYILPNWYEGCITLSKMVVDENILNDYLITPILSVTNDIPIKAQSPKISISNIKTLCSFINMNDYNTYCDEYDVLNDFGYFFTGMNVDYYASVEEYVTSSIESNLGSLAIDLMGFIPVLGETLNTFSVIFDFFELMDGNRIIYDTITSENSFVSENKLLYCRSDEQISGYGCLLKDYYTEYNGPSLRKSNDHITSRFQYSYGYKNTPTKILETISFNIKYYNETFYVFYGNTKEINEEENSIEIDKIIKNEYNECSCKSIYRYVSRTNQELEICCGDNNVLIYEDDILVSTNKKYNFIKNKEYKISVINNSETGIKYNFYLKGYEINDIISLDNNEEVLYTFISNITDVCYINVDAYIKEDILFFKENEIYQLLIKNTDDKKNINISIENIDNAILDEDGHVLNDAKYVKIENDESLWYIEYKTTYKNYYILNNELQKSSSNYATDDIFYIDAELTETLSKHKLELNVYFNDILIYDEYKYLSIEPDGIFRYEYEEDELSVNLLTTIILYEGGKSNSHFDTETGQFEVNDGCGKYQIILIFSVKDKNQRFKEIGISQIFNFYYVPEYGEIKYEENNCNKVIFSLTGIYEYVSCDFIYDKNYLLINENKQNKNILKYDIIFIASELSYIYKFYDFSIYLADEFDYMPTIYTNLIDSSGSLYKIGDNSFRVRISQFKYEYNNGNITYLISTLEQLKFVLTYNYYGYITYDDGTNFDVEIYGNINDYNFKLTNDIDCNGAYIYINVGILFGGILDGCECIISNLNFVVVKDGFISNSRYRGIFESNYGIIKNIKFKNVIFDITELQKNIDTTKYKNGDGKIVGFITPANYGTIENIKYNNCKYKYMYYDKQLIGGKWKVRYKEINESNQLEF